MLLRPTSPVSVFLTVRVGVYCIHPIKRPRQGDECGCPVISQGDLLGSSGPCPSSAMGWGLAPTGPHMPIPIYTGKPPGPCRARFGGVCCCALRLRFSFFDRQGRGVLHTPYQTSPSRGRMWFLGYVDGAFVGGVRALWCPFVGRMLLRPTSPVPIFRPSG